MAIAEAPTTTPVAWISAEDLLAAVERDPLVSDEDREFFRALTGGASRLD